MNLCQQHPNYQHIKTHQGTGSVIPLYKVHSRKLTPHKQSSAINMNCVQCMTLTQVTRIRMMLMLLLFFVRSSRNDNVCLTLSVCPFHAFFQGPFEVLFYAFFLVILLLKLSFKLFFKLSLKLKDRILNMFPCYINSIWYRKLLMISGLPHSFSTILFASSSGSSGNRKCFRKSPKHQKQILRHKTKS